MMDNFQPMLMMLLSSTLHTNDANIETKFIYGLISVVVFLFVGFTNKIDVITILADKINDYLYNFNQKNQVIIYLESHKITVRGSGSTTITKVKYSDDYLAILDYITTNHKRIKNLKILKEIMTNYMEKYWDDTDSSNYMKIPVQNEDIIIDEDNKIYCQILTNKNNDDDNKKSNLNNSKTYDIRLYKWIEQDIYHTREVLLNFIAMCKENYDEKINPKFQEKKFIYEYFKTETNEDNCKDDLKYKEYIFESNKTFDNLFFDEKDEMINYVNKFIFDKKVEKNEYEETCSKCGITYKAGMLFYGEPGCGKTSAIKAILNYTNRIGIIINLGKIKSNEELESVFRNYVINKRKYIGKQICFILEDCDAFENDVLLDRKDKKNCDQVIENNTICSLKKDSNIQNTINISDLLKKDCFDFSCLLNIFDGMIELHGVMIIMTTNYPDKLDKALIREGRIDLKHEFKLASTNVIKNIVQRKFNISDEEYDNLDHISDLKSNTLSPAKIQNFCSKEEDAQKAINKIYEKQFI